MLYVHIPFCVRRCKYCDFNSYVYQEGKKEQYLKDLIKEIKMYSKKSFEDNGNINIQNLNTNKLTNISKKNLESDKETKSIQCLDNDEITSIFIGGGTPSILSSEELKIIFEEIYKNFNVNKNAEITIESNPGTLNIEKLQTMLECGVNRLSIGLQSTFDKHLKYIGRIHTFEEFLKNYSEARNCGFSNINIDLMYSLPNQTMEEWKETLETVVKLNPEHISAYSLILEEGTELYEMESKNEFQLNDEEIDIQMYRYTINFLQKHGYNQYEISNYAKSRCNQNEASNYTKSRYNQNEASNYSKSKCKQYKIPNCEKQDNKYKSFECEHNKGYWKCEEYIGVGAGSSGFIGDVRYNNVCDLETYHNMIKKGIKPIENKDILTEKDFIEEKIFMGLRMNEGIYFDEFEKKFKINFAEVYKNEIEKLSKQNLIEIIYDKKSIAGIKLTQTGREISNTVFVEFLR